MAVDIRKHVASLRFKEEFLSLFLSNVPILKSDKIPTACIALRGMNLELWYNEEFFENMSTKQIHGVLKHEVLHIVFGHLGAFGKAFTNQKLANVAMDLQINQFVETNEIELPKPYLSINNPEFHFLKNHPKAGSSVYYDMIMQHAKDNPGWAEGIDSEYDVKYVDQDGNPAKPDSDGNLNGVSQEVIEDYLKAKVSQTTKNCGSLPNYVQESDFWKPVATKIDWKRQLRSAIETKESEDRRTLRTRRHKILFKKFPLSKGSIPKKKASILFAPDESGSISTEELSRAFNEMHTMYKKGFDVTVAHWDTDVHHVEEYTGKYNSMKRHASGGTCPIATLKYFKKEGFSVAVIVTDGYFNLSTEVMNTRRVIWVMLPGYNNPGLPGTVIHMD